MCLFVYIYKFVCGRCTMCGKKPMELSPIKYLKLLKKIAIKEYY